MRKHTIRPLQLVIAPQGEPQYCEGAVIVGLEDEAAGEYITICSSAPGDSDTQHTIAIDPDEWPYVCKAVNKLLKTAIGPKS